MYADKLEILVDGTPVPAMAGQSVALALLLAGLVRLRRSPGAGAPRGAFCLVGICQECLVTINGGLALACQVPVRPGLTVTREDHCEFVV